MNDSEIVVGGYRTTEQSDLNMRDDPLSLALDQRFEGPRRLVVAVSDRAGRLLGIGHTERTDPPELGLAPCIMHVGHDADVAIAYCDERVVDGPPPPDLAERFARARAAAGSVGVHLVDWFACDDLLVRSTRVALDPDGEWWDVPQPQPPGVNP
jgi:hypothetical protein